MGESRLIVEEAFPSSISQGSPRPSLSTHFSSLDILDGVFSRKSSSCNYDSLPSETLRLSVLKLDGSCFDVEVAETATVAELKQGVEAAFSHIPSKGPGKISWPHVWGQFCLCYDGQKLVTETDYLRNYSIKDGDQLRFIRHVSNNCSFREKRLKKRVVNLKQHMRSSSHVNRYQQKEHGGDNDIGLDGIVIENGNIQKCNKEEDRVGKNRLTGFCRGLFSYTWLAIVRRDRTEGRICPSMVARVILGSFRNIRRIVCFWRRRYYSRKHTLYSVVYTGC